MLYRGKKNLEKCDNFIMKFLDYTKELIKIKQKRYCTNPFKKIPKNLFIWVDK